MKISASNNDTVPHYLTAGRLDVPPGTTRSVIGCTAAQVAEEMSRSSRLFQVQTSLDPSDSPVLFAIMSTPANPGAGITVSLGQGLTIKDAAGVVQAITEMIGVGLFDDAACTVPSVTATITAIATGTIQVGLNKNAVEATTAAGVISLTVTKLAVGTVYLKSFSVPGGKRIVDASDTHAIVYT